MLALVAAATFMRVAVDPYVLGTQYPTFFLAAIFSTVFGGLCVGLLSVLLSALSAWYFLSTRYSFALVEGEVASLLSFAVVASLMVFIIGSLQQAYVIAQTALGRAAALEEERARVADELRLGSDVFHNATLGIGVVDGTEQTIRSANAAYASLHAMSANDITGQSLFDMYPHAERDCVADFLAASDGTGHAIFEADRIRKDGSTFPARVQLTTVRRSNGEVRYRIETVEDITQRRQRESEFSQVQRLEAIGQLSAGVAHDFNNMLQGILAHLELVDDDTDVSPATRDCVDAAIRLAEQGGELTHNLLAFARKQPLAPGEVCLGDFLERFRRLLSRTLDPRIRIEVVTEPGLAPVWADERYLQNALLNLAINARDAMPSGGNLRIEALDSDSPAVNGPVGIDTCAGRYLRRPARLPDHCSTVIRVTDTGTGISPEHLDRVCEPFFSTKGLNGTGLGLSMVHGFAKQSGGELRIVSEPGKGTSVEIWLPHPSTASRHASH